MTETNTSKNQLIIDRPLLEYMHPWIVELLERVPIPEELINMGGKLYMRQQGIQVNGIDVVAIGAFVNHIPENKRIVAVAGFNKIVAISENQTPNGFSDVFNQVIHSNEDNIIAKTEDGSFTVYLNN